MNNEKFTIRAYGKSELAMLYLPHHSKATALKVLNSWISYNPRLRTMRTDRKRFFTPRQVKKIVEELGEPFDIE